MPIYDWNSEDDPDREITGLDQAAGWSPSQGIAEFIFTRFTRLVEVHGGMVRDEPHDPEDIPELNLPPILAEQWDISPDAYTSGCTGHTTFALPYEKEDASTGYVAACAVCDHGASWPRLKPATNGSPA